MPSIEQTPGRFVVLEGLDGAGTTTQAGLLATALRARDLRVCETAEPSDGPLGEVLRAHVRGEITLDPVTAALTFTADRSDHLARVVRPALGRGEWVVCDRYLLSTLAYQGAEGVDRSLVLSASAGFEIPDLTVYLDVPQDVLERRLASRATAERYEAPALAERLRASYVESIELLTANGHAIEVLNGTEDPQMVLESVLTRLDATG
jgi:dTMP kinase